MKVFRKRRRAPLWLKTLRAMRYALETLGVYIIYGFFSLLPVAAASNTGGWLLSRIGPHMGASRTALRHLARALPEKTPQEHDEILRGMWDNLGRVIAEYPHLRRIAADRVEIVGVERFDLVRGGAGGIFIGGHIGNWEVGGLVARRHGIDVNVIYRKPNNPWIDSLLRHARGGNDIGHVIKGDKGAREMFTRLRGGEALGILMDQKLTEGIAVPFFGHPALTATAAAQFALKFNCPLLPIIIERLPDAHFRVHIAPPLDITATSDRDADILRILTQINRQLEDWIRARPSQWLWLHKRWADIN
ncbi:MAG: lauroyl acyltransferase [Alphaproteobacteria bacterium]|nr:lauroyl acyltransferase [Alphaproteobacteria bacterium]